MSAGAAHEVDLVRVLERAHAIERLVEVVDLRWRLLAGAYLRSHGIQRSNDLCVPSRIVTERVPQRFVVGDQVGKHRVEQAERIGLVETKCVARGVRAVTETLPHLAFLILVAAEEDRLLLPAADQNDHRFRLGKAGEVPEVAVETVKMVRVAVTHAFRRGRDNGDAVADLLEQCVAARRVGFVFHGFLRSS